MNRQRTKRPIGVGDRVVINDTEHPWYGEAGTVVRSFGRLDLEWVVRLNSGHECAVGKYEMARI